MDFSSPSSSSLYKSLSNPQIPSDRERMFEKVVTPSDVGKLNRLVIPKQHAEKYFPLDSAGGEKGLLLNFEESRSSGKSWRFRYSYWSSSQSYVITKGWSRFVKDKKLDAGDVVSFSRTLSSPNSDPRLYIDWSRRRRLPIASSSTLPNFHHGFSINVNPPPWCFNYSPNYNFPLHVGPAFPPPIHRGLGGLGGNYGAIRGNCQVGSQVGAGVGPAAPVVNKRLRLFGVNMDCTQEEGINPPSSSSSDGATTINFLGKGKSSTGSLDFEL